MTAEQTLANRRAIPEVGNDTRLVSVDVTRGASSDPPAWPGVNIDPQPLMQDVLAYVRKDVLGDEAGIYYSKAREGHAAMCGTRRGRRTGPEWDRRSQPPRAAVASDRPLSAGAARGGSDDEDPSD